MERNLYQLKISYALTIMHFYLSVNYFASKKRVKLLINKFSLLINKKYIFYDTNNSVTCSILAFFINFMVYPPVVRQSEIYVKIQCVWCIRLVQKYNRSIFSHFLAQKEKTEKEL